MLLRDKVILVTGSSRGIGKAVSDKCLACGATVIANYRKKNDYIYSIENQILTINADISNTEDVVQMMNTIKKEYGHLDGIVNNAAIISRTPDWKNIPEKDWIDVINTNIIGMWNIIRFGAELMYNGGSIVNISSIYGLFPDPKTLTYSISKSGVIALTQALAKELSPKIRINAITPGNTLTQMIPDDETLSIIEGKTLLKRSAQPDEIANTIAFLLSDQSSYITGAIIPVDGGYHII